VGRLRKPTIVLLGMASKKPVAGVVWQTVHYLVGFERLGYDVYYVEAHASTPTTLMRSPDDDSSALAAAFIERMMNRFGLSGRWAFHALHADGRCYGMSLQALRRLYRSADLVVNLHGSTTPLPDHAASGRLVYLETDPVSRQVELFESNRDTVEFLEPHVAFFTFAENYGRPGCGLPVTDLFEFRPTRQPVVLDFWAREGPPPQGDFRTIGSWHQDWGNIRFRDDFYGWSRHVEFVKFLDLPLMTGQGFEPAFAKGGEPLQQKGWKVRDALSFSYDIDAYRAFVHGSRGEFSVAKDQNVRLRSGWFSDRSATFLASGLPVVAQDTAFDCVLPTGEGLFAFLKPEEAADAIGRIDAEPERHGRGALDIAREYFSHEVVLGQLLSELGMRPPVDVGSRRHAPQAALPASLVVMPVSRHPTELDPSTVETLLHWPTPRTSGRRVENGPSRPVASVVVVSHDNLPLTRMCLESVLDESAASIELIVIDNASGFETQAYLTEREAQHPCVRVILNPHNASFAAAVNQGLAVAVGGLLVILNNDTIVTPGWLDGLARHLEDPSVGLVSPVTNQSGNEAQVDVPYRTYGELVDFARDRVRAHRGQAFDIPVATMFCAAMRSDVYARIGPLDECYEVGMFEDDDYSLRMRMAGLRVLCAEDVFVHHFGKGSFGSLVPTGDYAAVFEANRRRFEAKWGLEWKTHSRRPNEAWEWLVEGVRGLVGESVPRDGVVLVVNRGDQALLDLGGRAGWHFPRNSSREYAGYYPADGAEAIEHLESLRRQGATHLVIPSTELWWLDHYAELFEHLETEHREVGRTSAGVAYELL
jgi:GT2 family glycosyltransferase